MIADFLKRVKYFQQRIVLQMVVAVEHALRIHDECNFRFGLASVIRQAIPEDLHFPDCILNFRFGIVAAPHIEEPERRSVHQRTAEFAPHSRNIRCGIRPRRPP